jgi:hypothetical protein
MKSSGTPRRINLTPAVSGDTVLEAFLHSIDSEADIDAYLHHQKPQIRPGTEVLPTDHQMDDGRTAYVFRMGKPRYDLRDYIVVVTSINGKLVASSA